MPLIDELLEELPGGEVRAARIGLHWTAVVAETESDLRCGLASTLPSPHDHPGGTDLPEAGRLEGMDARAIAGWLRADPKKDPIRRSLGAAALNALLPPRPEEWVDRNASEVIAERGEGKRVVLIGGFPFVPGLRKRVGELIVLDQRPREGVLPADRAEEFLPGADVAAITGMTLLNGTLESLLAMTNPGATILLLGPSTPLAPALYRYNVDLLSGSVVTDREAVFRVLGEGGTFRQIHRAGVRLVTMERKGKEERAG